ncbi:HECT-domain-containing protein [Rhizophagus clarus]|uniref:HECT-type E3 ubiquitin transferase n=1 Tax=Rhizophagus clarus TaxID=94130 RepID=A0A8H3LLG2_9GLOM|nr:HECT-domain-containing protein [Rhizophagus clarus]
MYNTFEGNYKTRRAINLGGKRQQETKEELLRKNQDRRKARENERLKEKSAIKIQAFYRGRTVAGKLRDNERDSWDQQAKFMMNNAQSERDVAFNLINLARSFLFFYRPQYDSQRKLYLYQILWKQIHDSETMFVPFYYDDLRVMWTLQLKRTLVIFLKNIGTNIMKPDQYTHNINYLKTLLLPMDVSKYQRIQDINREEIYQGIIESLVENGLYTELRNCLINLQLEDKNNPVILLSTLSLRPFQILPSEHKAYKLSLYNFIAHIFTIPLLLNRMSDETLPKKFSSRLPLNDIILKLSEMVGDISDTEQKIILLGNLLAFAYKNFSVIDKLAYMEVLQNLALQIPTHFLVDKSDVSNNDDDEDDEGDEDIVMSNRPELATMPKIDPQILEGISVLFDKQHLASFFALMKAAKSLALLKISNFFVTLMIRWPTKKTELLNSIIYSASDNRSAITLLWNTFKATDLARLLLNSQSVPNGIMTDLTFSEHWGLFTLLCELYSRVLFTMGDDEFFDESKNPLKLTEIINMSICMKHVGYSLYWSNNTLLKMDSVIEGAYVVLLNNLRDIVTKLLRQIHARDSRRQFTPSDHWLMTSEIDMNVFVEAVVREEQELERDNDKINLNKRQLANISPRLGILDNIPFVIPFEVRIKIFREYVDNDKKRDRHYDVFPHPRTRVTIRRTSVFEDGFTHLNALGSGLKSPVAIQFIDEFGMPEAGIDGGGLFKEFLTSLTRIAFDTNYGLFLSTKEQLLYPNPHGYAKQETQLEYYEFIGRILGKALYEGILVDAAFAGFFLSKWLGRSSYLDDLPTLDPELYQGLIYLKNYKGNVESDLSLNFTVVDNEFGESRTIELIPGGSDIPVTNENRIRYIYMMAHYRLNRQIDRQCKAFFRGLSNLIDEKWLRMFNQEELQILVGGAYIPINIEDLRQNAVYSDYKEDDPVITNFWKELNPKFSIRNAGPGTRLPSSSTCVNLLKLPAYSDEDTLREKLLYAINADVGKFFKRCNQKELLKIRDFDCTSE